VVVTTDEVLNYLGIDYADDMVTANISRLINTADSYLKGAIGENYPIDNPKAKELALLLISDLYDNRGLTSASSNTVRKLISDLEWQLKMELRRSANE